MAGTAGPTLCRHSEIGQFELSGSLKAFSRGPLDVECELGLPSGPTEKRAGLALATQKVRIQVGQGLTATVVEPQARTLVCVITPLAVGNILELDPRGGLRCCHDKDAGLDAQLPTT